MKKTLLILPALVLGGYFYVQTTTPCARPIPYTIAIFDPRFHLSQAEFLSATKEAGAVWSKVAGKELFVYDPKGSSNDLKINLIYDKRQATADKNKTLESNVGFTKESADTLKSQYSTLEADYKAKEIEYTTLLAAYKDRQVSFATLEEKRVALNTLAGQINALIKQYNSLADTVNTTVDTINQTAGQEFEEGQYVSDNTGQRIDIFEFKDRSELIRVMAHELGHSLGLDHNSNPNSIMYYLNQNTNIIPTTEDVAGLKKICTFK